MNCLSLRKIIPNVPVKTFSSKPGVIPNVNFTLLNPLIEKVVSKESLVVASVDDTKKKRPLRARRSSETREYKPGVSL